MELRLISKMYKKGFTMIEMVLVLGLVSLIAVISVSVSLPAITQFSCIQKAKAVAMALELARHKSQFSKSGNIAFGISSVDEFDESTLVPVVFSRDIVFEEYSGGLVPEASGPNDNAIITIGGQEGEGSVGCTRTIAVTVEGAITQHNE